MIAPLAYYLFVLPVSYLPIGVLYIISDVLAFFFYNIYQYRGKVLDQNLRNSFPNRTESEIKTLKKNFYRHFSDILVESVKNITASQSFLEQRMVVENREVLDRLYRERKSVLLVSGHFNNWEYVITAQNFLLSHQAAGIGMPLSNKFWDKQLNQQRERFGMRVIHAGNVKEKFEAWKNETIATLVLADQSPSNSRKSYWMDFLSQKTAVLFGPELLAKKYDQPVVYFSINKIKRGYYSIKFDMITDTPNQTEYGFITEQHAKRLEQEILKNPEFWIWTHKRWKREVPDDVRSLREEQKVTFEKKLSKKSPDMKART